MASKGDERREKKGKGEKERKGVANKGEEMKERRGMERKGEERRGKEW